MTTNEPDKGPEPLLEWRAEFELGHADMDATHVEFVELLNAAQQAPKEAFEDRFNALVMHTRKHFEAEDEWMKQTGFFAITEHIGEHHRVLGQLDYFNKRVHLGFHSLGRAMLKELPSWFELHAKTMDSALAAHLKAKASAFGQVQVNP